MCVRDTEADSALPPIARRDSSSGATGPHVEMSAAAFRGSSRALVRPSASFAETAILYGDERKQLGKVVRYAIALCVYILATILLPTFLSEPLARNFGLVPTTNLVFVAPMWILGTCLWRMAGDSRSAAIFGLGWLISAFASFALGWADMQSWATVVHGISVREWDRNEVADGYYFTDGYVGVEFQVTGHQPQCAAGTQRCSEYSWSLAPVFASPLCAQLNSTKQVEQHIYNVTTHAVLSSFNVTVPALNDSATDECRVLFIAMQVEPSKGVGLIGRINLGGLWPDEEDMCGEGGSGGLCTRLSPYSPHACEPYIGSSARMPDPTLLGCAPKATCRQLMEQPFLPPSRDVCNNRYFAIGNLQKAADDGRTTAAIMFAITGLLFLASVTYKCKHDIGFVNSVRTIRSLTRRRRGVRQAADLGV
mmetsp:Transcript_9034/g.22427  ORF Transcript_9034/g.22427 Transcript_9034/m.22427 type:complete len:422 (-) Transcript_9034:566-1831(-)